MSAEEKYGPRLVLTLCYASSQDDTHPVNSLRFQQSNTTGWQSCKNANYPQELGFRFEGQVQLESIRLLAHESKISSCIDVLVADATAEELETGVCGPYKDARFSRLGHVRFSDNEDSQHKARELKTIGIRRKCVYIKLLFRRPHMNAYNLFNQVGVVSMCAYGAMLRPFNTWLSCPLSVRVGAVVDVALSDMRPLAFQEGVATPSAQPNLAGTSGLLDSSLASNTVHVTRDEASVPPNAIVQKDASNADKSNNNNTTLHGSNNNVNSFTNNNTSDSSNDGNAATATMTTTNTMALVERRVVELQNLKSRAVFEEEYDLADALKHQIAALQKTRTRIAELEVRKKEAVAQEDYRLAKELKQELDALQLMTYDQPDAQAMRSSSSLPLCGDGVTVKAAVTDNSEIPISTVVSRHMSAMTSDAHNSKPHEDALLRENPKSFGSHTSQTNNIHSTMKPVDDGMNRNNKNSHHSNDSSNNNHSYDPDENSCRQKTSDDIPVRGKGYYDVEGGFTANSVPSTIAPSHSLSSSSHTRFSPASNKPGAGQTTNSTEIATAATKQATTTTPLWADPVQGEWERQLNAVLLGLYGEEQPEPLAGPSVAEAAPFVRLFGKLCCACLFGKRGQLREAGIRAVSCNDGLSALHMRHQSSSSSAPASPGAVSADILKYFATKSHGLADPVTGVVFVTCEVLQRIARGELGSEEPAVPQLRSEFSALVRDMVSRLADANARVRESVMAVVHRLVHSEFGPERFIAQVYNDADVKKGANANARVYLSHMELFDGWIDEYGVHAARPNSGSGNNANGSNSSVPWLDVRSIMEKIVLPNMQRASADVRNAAVQLFAKLTLLDPRASAVFMSHLKSAQRVAVTQQLATLKEKKIGEGHSSTAEKTTAASAGVKETPQRTNSAKPSTVSLNKRDRSLAEQQSLDSSPAAAAAARGDDKKSDTTKNSSRHGVVSRHDNERPNRKGGELIQRNSSVSPAPLLVSTPTAAYSLARKGANSSSTSKSNNNNNTSNSSNDHTSQTSSISSSQGSLSRVKQPARQSPVASPTRQSTLKDTKVHRSEEHSPPPPSQQNRKSTNESSLRGSSLNTEKSSVTTIDSTRSDSIANDSTVATLVSETTNTDRTSSASSTRASSTNNHVEQQVEQMCQFCGEHNPKFDEASLDEHYMHACPMLCPCPLCDQVTEISTLQQHLVEECEGRNLVRQCPRCNEAVQAEDLTAHIKAKTCIKADLLHSVCPLCHSRFTNDIFAWRKHLASAPAKKLPGMSHGSPFSASQLYSNANASVTAEVRRDIKFLIDTEVLTTTPETNNEVVTRLAEHIRNGSSEIVLETLKPNFKYGSLEYQLRMLNLLNECVIHSGPQFIALLSGEKWLDRIFKVAKTTNSAQLRDKIMINTIQWYNQSHTSGLQRLMGRFSHSNKLGVHFRAVVSDLTKRSQSIQSQSDNFFESGHHQQTFDTITEPNPNEALETEETMLLQFQGDLASLEYALEHPQFLEDTDSAQDCKNNKLVCMRMLESGQHERIASELMSLIERISETLELYEAMTGKDMDEGELSRNRGAGVSAMDDDLAESDSDDDLQQQQIRNLRAKKKMKGSRVDANRLLAEAQQNNNALAENERAETERLRTELTELRRKHEELQNKFKSAKAKNKEAISMLEQYASEVESLQKGNKANNAATALPVASPRSSISADKVEHLGEKVSSLRIDLRELRESMGEGVRKEANYYRTQLMAAMASVVKAAQNDREADQRTLQWTQELYRKEMKLRKQYYNTIQELKGNIRVFCRVRPMIPMELKDGHTDVMTYPSPDTIRFVDATGRFKSFEFDEVYNPQVPQLKVFEDTAPLIDSVVDGFNVCIFAYGQTGSGKTYTMSGGEDEAKGINTRALERLFAIIEDRKYTEVSTVTLSVLEIYCEQINDLLVSKRVSASTNYDIKQGGPHGTYVTNLTEVPVNSPREIHRIMEMANKNRSEGTTNMNEHSSRSHMLLYIVVRTKNVQTNIESFGKLSLVDLAGSERLDKSGAEGQMLKETVAINKSLSSLGDVIAGLVQNARHIPFRNSTLTFLLQDSMAGQAKVLMFVCIGPASYNVSESSNSLQFASRARGVAFGQIKKNQAIERK